MPKTLPESDLESATFFLRNPVESAAFFSAESLVVFWNPLAGFSRILESCDFFSEVPAESTKIT